MVRMGKAGSPLAAIGLTLAFVPFAMAQDAPPGMDATRTMPGGSQLDAVPVQSPAGDQAPLLPTGWLSNVSYSFSGFTRVETAIRATNQENPYNQNGNLFNGKPTARCGGLPPTTVCLFPDEATRTGTNANNEFNLEQFRTHLDLSVSLSSAFTARALVRGIYELGAYDRYQPSEVDSHADGYLYGKPNYFEYDNFGSGGCQNRLEVCGRNYMVDLPALTLDYQQGPLLVRVGNQQIAWGQALFFRVLDLPNGLDLRRHFFLDYTPEEYADERVSSPGIRASYQITNEWEVDSYAQLFQPTIYPNPNTPYNVIASQFTIHDQYHDVDNKIDYGLRFRGNLYGVGLQFVYTTGSIPTAYSAGPIPA